MGLPYVLEKLRDRPGMFIPKVDFDVVAAFITGFNQATRGGLLAGFREWLVVRCGDGNNLPWPALVLRLTFPDAESPDRCLLQGGNQKFAVDRLFDLLQAYFQEKESPDGMRRIYVRYERWLL